MELFFFIIFASIAVISAVLVVTMRNPVHSVVALIVCFFQVACLFVLLRSPFLAGAQLFVYVGAIMIFFLFAVFLLDIKSSMLKQRFSNWAYVAIPLGLFMLTEVLMLLSQGSFNGKGNPDARVTELLDMGKSTEALGRVLYTKYLLPFEVISVVLLVGFIGAVVLTVRKKEDK